MLNGRWPHGLSSWNWVWDAIIIRDGRLGAFSVIVQLHRLIDLRHYSCYCCCCCCCCCWGCCWCSSRCRWWGGWRQGRRRRWSLSAWDSWRPRWTSPQPPRSGGWSPGWGQPPSAPRQRLWQQEAVRSQHTEPVSGDWTQVDWAGVNRRQTLKNM